MKKLTSKKKLTSILLTASLLTTLFTGCGGSSSSTESTNTGTNSTGGTSPSVQEESIVRTGEFEMWTSIHSMTTQAYSDLNDHPAAARIEESTGVLVEFTHPAVGQEQVAFNLLTVGGKLPDVVRHTFPHSYRGGVDGAIADQIIMDATPLIEQYATNFMAIINADEDLKKGAYTDGGAIAYFGSCIPGEEMRGLPFNGPLINKTYLDQVGLDVPETIDEWEVMLAAFKDELGIIPFSFGCHNQFGGTFDAFAGAYGIRTGSQFFQDNGTVKYSPLEPGYKDFVGMLSKWYANGWLDPEYLGKALNNDVRPDFDSGKIGSAILHSNSVSTLPTNTTNLGLETMEAVPAPYPVLNKGEVNKFRHNVTDFNLSPMYLAKDVENPVEIIEWIDWLYSDEGVLECTWGTLGESADDMDNTYYIDEDGSKQFTKFITENPDGITGDQAYRYYLMRDIMTVWEWENQSLMYKDPKFQECWDVWQGSATTDGYIPTTITLTIEETDAFTNMKMDIDTYVNEMTAKFISGAESLDNYDKFIAQVEKMGANELIEIQQAALDRYNNR